MCRGTVIFILILSVWLAALHQTHADVYTSSKKIEQMVLNEDQILNNLQAELTNLGNQNSMSYFSKFYQDRVLSFKDRLADEHLPEYLKHPNGIYHSIKDFSRDYEQLRKELESSPSPTVQAHLSSVACPRDVLGARKSFIRLQEVYGLNPTDMVKGDYFGHTGPSLTALDAFEIAQASFAEGKSNKTIAWLEAALSLRTPEDTYPTEGQILALQGRAHIRLGNDAAAFDLYDRSMALDPTNGDSFELEKELSSKPRLPEVQSLDGNHNFRRLCTLQNKLTSGKFDPRLKCSYRETVLPYYRFKHELLSVSPYACLFYDVLSDNEAKYVQEFVEHKLTRGLMEFKDGAGTNEGRTSDLSFVNDHESKVFARLSKRVSAMTYLDTSQHPTGFPYTGEPFQVVNYGMGGHYGVHMDTFDENFKINNKLKAEECGNRLATFLIYLSDVELGGATAFPNINIAVKPVKNMALFWYSANPAGKIDTRTLHAGCPVIVGHKWVSNKWIWTLGNMFVRRCGLTEDATQLDIDEDMKREWK